MKKRICALAVVTVALCACLFALAGCGSSDQKDLIGEWKVQGTNVTVVYDDKQTLTLNEADGNGGTKTTVFDKVSSNGDAEPSVDGVAESAAEDTGN